MSSENKRSFILYSDYRQPLECLPDETRGKLFLALFDYADRGDIPNLDAAAMMAFQFIKARMDADTLKWKATCENRAKAGRAGGMAKAANVANATSDSKPSKSSCNDVMCSDVMCSDSDRVNLHNTKANEKGLIGFDAFWKAYPRKANKPASEKAFAKIKPDAALLNKMLTALNTQKASSQWQKDSGQFIPYPATWLNGHRWEDDEKELYHGNDDEHRSNSGYGQVGDVL
ncbi:MAG: DUF6291 domain-containing protein [Faecalibacterium sp.]|jgi:hypothetical protein|nr:DUF6291 domain-containing protein [Faecalibacterium sp.]